MDSESLEGRARTQTRSCRRVPLLTTWSAHLPREARVQLPHEEEGGLETGDMMAPSECAKYPRNWIEGVGGFRAKSPTIRRQLPQGWVVLSLGPAQAWPSSRGEQFTEGNAAWFLAFRATGPPWLLCEGALYRSLLSTLLNVASS